MFSRFLSVGVRMRERAVHSRWWPGERRRRGRTRIAQLLNQRLSIADVSPVGIEELLRREPVKGDAGTISALVQGRVMLVTGAGGSIGSELCRQLAQLGPSAIVLLGHGENSIHEIHQDLEAGYPHLRLHRVIADIRNRKRIAEVMREHRPHVVFHAAAHKHVPLMEENLAEAIGNNVTGTQAVVEAAAAAAVPHFVMVSTDKAVNPASIMGATKRIAELIVQREAEQSGFNYVSVRFGNVLGSRGSVVPLFLRQIRARRAVTVTHPDMVRYFMTIPEAVQLVLHAAALGSGGEVFVLDMGEPVRIGDLARDLIEASGLTVGTDVEICYTGLRAGEKLFEELFRKDEVLVPTAHDKVLSARRGGLPIGLGERVAALVKAADARVGTNELRELISRLVPEYQGERGADHRLVCSSSSRDSTDAGTNMSSEMAAISSASRQARSS